MVSIIACLKKLPELARVAMLGLALCCSGLLSAAEIEIPSAQLLSTDDGYVLSADFSFELSQRLEEAVNKGVVLHFLFEFEMGKRRWYWFDEKLVARQTEVRLYYHALTRQYRLTTGGLHQSFSTLGEALRVLSRVRSWLVIERAAAEKLGLRAGDSYQAAVRMKLDISQLPKPFQVAAFGNRDWNLSSDWKSWQLVLPGGESR